MNANKSVRLTLLLWVTLSHLACGAEPGDEVGDSDPKLSENDTSTDTWLGIQMDNEIVSPLTQIINKTYILDFPSAHWTKPAGQLGEELGSFTPKFALTITSVDETTMTFTALLGTTKNGAQDPCNKTYTIQGTLDNSNGSTAFSTPPLDINAIIEGLPEDDARALGVLRGFTLSGQFFNQGDGYKFGGLLAELDGREVYPVFTGMTPIPDTAEQLCKNLDLLGLECEPCSSDTSKPLCFTVEASLFKVYKSTGLALRQIPQTDQSCL